MITATKNALDSDKTGQTPPQPQRDLRLVWEIAAILALKFILLWLLWYFFFSAPQAKHMQVPEPQVTQHLLSTTR